MQKPVKRLDFCCIYCIIQVYIPIRIHRRIKAMLHKTINTVITASLIFVLAGCLNLSENTNTAAQTQTQLYGYFQLAGSIGCYGDPADTTLAGKYITAVYTLSMADDNTLMICAAAQESSDTTISPSVLSNKTINFYATNTAPTATGTYMDLTAIKIPTASTSTTTVFYVLGTTTPCPDGSSSKVVGYLDMTNFKSYKYIEAYDSCAGQLVGSAVSPLEAQRQIGG